MKIENERGKFKDKHDEIKFSAKVVVRVGNSAVTENTELKFKENCNKRGCYLEIVDYFQSFLDQNSIISQELGIVPTSYFTLYVSTSLL